MNHDNYPTVVSFFTPSWEYEEHSKRLEMECKKLGLKYFIEKMEDSGSWFGNTRLKPIFLLKALEELKTNILWIDVDGSILKLPDIMKGDVEFDILARPKPKNQSRIWHVGTLYFKYNENTIKFIKDWIEFQQNNEGSDELCLDKMWKAGLMDYLNIGELPPEYFELMPVHKNHPNKNSVVAHRQSQCSSKKEYFKKLRNG